MINLSSRSNCKFSFAVSSFSGGGAERVMVTLANYFFEKGYVVNFIVLTDQGPYRKLIKDDINLIVLRNHNKNRYFDIIKSMLKLWQYFITNRASIMLVTLRKFNVFVLLVYMFSLSKTDVYVREADFIKSSIFSNSFYGKLLYYGMKYLYPKAKGIIANSQATKKSLIQTLDLKEDLISVIYNPLNDRYLSNAIIGAEKNDKPTIVACGRLVEKKNFSDLIKAFPYILPKIPDAVLLILGEGVDRSKLESLINTTGLNGKIILKGFVDNPYAYFASAHVFVQTSLWEGFGYVLAEAMACGTSVVAYDSKGAMREILADGKYGKLVPAGDLVALAEAVIDMYNNPTPVELLKEAVDKFKLNKVADDYLKLFSKNSPTRYQETSICKER